MSGLPAASLIGLPWQIAFAAHDDGWIIRNAIVWHHPSTETQLVTDRCTRSYELIFLLVNQQRHYFSLDAIRQQLHRPGNAATPQPGTRGNQETAGCRGGGSPRSVDTGCYAACVTVQDCRS